MVVFISYSHEDEALVHFLAYVLQKGGIECRLDRQLLAARRIDEGLRAMIESVDLVLVLLSERSLTSLWVNQEIGFATALGKAVYPLVVEKDVKPEGFLTMCGAYSLLDWRNPNETIDSLIADLKREAKEPTSRDVPFLNKMLDNRHARSKFLNKKLEEFVRETERELTIRQQAAFSIFATSDDAEYANSGEHSPEFLKLLLEERRLTDQLVKAPNTKYRLILWPVSDIDHQFQAIRFANLLRWLREVQADPTIEFRCGTYPEPSNRLVISGEFVLDGFKPQRTAGFDLSLAQFQPEKINEAQCQFDNIWNRLKHDKAQAIKLIEDKANALDRQD